MPNRRVYDMVLGMIITNKAFGDRFLRNPQEAIRSRGFQLSEAEVEQLGRLNPIEVWRFRMSLGVQ